MPTFRASIKRLVLPLLGALTCVATLQAELPNRTAREAGGREVVVGAYPQHTPYSFQSSTAGEVEGFAVELLDAIARVMNLQLRRVVLENTELRERFRAGEFDMLQMLGEAQERETWADYSIPIIYTQHVAFARRSAHMKSFAELRGKRFVLPRQDSPADQFLKAHQHAGEIIYTDSVEKAVRMVDAGQADATLLSRVTTLALLEKLALRNVVELRDPAAYIEIRHAFAVHKGDAWLLAQLNEGLAILQRSGEYDRLHRKWLGRFEPLRFTHDQVVRFVATFLAFALVIAIWAALRQRTLYRRITVQARDLAEKGELLRTLYDNVPHAMLVLDLAADGDRVRSLNRRATDYLGLRAENVLGRKLDELSLPPDWAELCNVLRQRARQDKGIVVEKHILPRTHKHVMVTRAPLSTHPDGAIRLCVLVEDVTDRWRFDEEVAQGRRLRAIGELVGGIAHEFNNLMTPVVLKIDDIRAQRPNDRELQTELEVVSSAARRAAELTARLLTFGRKNEGGAESLLLASAVQEALEFLRPASDRRIVWENRVTLDLAPLVFNPNDLNQILVNLLLNARDTLLEKLSTPGASGWVPTIRVEAVQLPADAFEKPSGHADRELFGWQRLIVSDNGMGMEADVRERIFEPFYSTKPVGRGTGLGLATVWHLLNASGGRIEVETTPGEGSSFYAILPLWTPPPAPAIKPSRLPGSAASVLLVEDETLVAGAMAKLLERAGHTVRCIDDGYTAWDHLRVNLHAHDLLILDINMPGIDGIELSRRAREAGYTGGILVVSGRFATTEVAQFDRLGIDGVLPKPFRNDELLAMVEACLNKRSRA